MEGLVGANGAYILNHIPHASRLMVEAIEGVADHADFLLIDNSDAEFESVAKLLNEGQTVTDPVRLDSPLGAGLMGPALALAWIAHRKVYPVRRRLSWAARTAREPAHATSA